MNLEQLRYFVTIAQLENVSRAAEVYHLSQSSLSKMISKMENELGTPLFERNGKRIRLNAAGTRFLEGSLMILQEADRTVSDLQMLSGEEALTIRVGFAGRINDLINCIHDFKAIHPRMQFDLRSDIEWIEHLDINDYDGDGNKECLIQEDGGGSAGPEPPYIVYYDSEARQYRKTETIDNLGQTPEVVTENGQTSILFRRGIQWVRYVFENHAVRETENDHKDMGEAQMAVTTSMLFREDEIDSKKVECDLDDDGIPEVLTLSHNDSHASNFGKDMMLDNITWGRDQSETSTYMMGERFVVLKSKTNNVRDLLMDYFYYRWDGTKYVPWMWNGDSFILVQEQD